MIRGKVIYRIHGIGGNVVDDAFPDIFYDGEKRLWRFSFPINDVIDFVITKSVTDNAKEKDGNVKAIITDEDRDLILTYMQGGVANVVNIMARRMPNMPVYTSDFVIMELMVGENHDDSMLHVLYMRVMDYLCEYTYRRFYGHDQEELSAMEDRIRTAIHYRKHGIVRKIRNFI